MLVEAFLHLLRGLEPEELLGAEAALKAEQEAAAQRAQQAAQHKAGQARRAQHVQHGSSSAGAGLARLGTAGLKLPPRPGGQVGGQGGGCCMRAGPGCGRRWAVDGNATYFTVCRSRRKVRSSCLYRSSQWLSGNAWSEGRCPRTVPEGSSMPAARLQGGLVHLPKALLGPGNRAVAQGAPARHSRSDAVFVR